MQDVDSIVSRALAAFRAAGDGASLENAKARFLGKAGELTALQSTLKSAPAGERKTLGAKFNAAKREIEEALEARRAELAQQQLEARLSGQALDVTLPARGSYGQFREFVGAVLKQMPVASLDGLRFERKRPVDTQLDGQLRLTIYARPPGELP